MSVNSLDELGSPVAVAIEFFGLIGREGLFNKGELGAPRDNDEDDMAGKVGWNESVLSERNELGGLEGIGVDGGDISTT